MYASRAVGPWWAAFLTELALAVCAGAHLKLSRRSISYRLSLSPSVLLSGLAIALGTIAYTIGVLHYNVSIVAALGNSTAIIATAVGVIFFRERLHKRETIAVLAMIIGVIAISVH